MTKTKMARPRIKPDPLALTEQALEREKIVAVWPRLPKPHRVVLSLHEIEGYSLEEVAEIVNVPVGTPNRGSAAHAGVCAHC